MAEKMVQYYEQFGETIQDEYGGWGYHGFHNISDERAVAIDGFTTENHTFHVLAPDGSDTMIDTGVVALIAGDNDVNYYTVNCLTQTANGVNFGDLFIKGKGNVGDEGGSFGYATQYFPSDGEKHCYEAWYDEGTPQFFSLSSVHVGNNSNAQYWRLARVI